MENIGIGKAEFIEFNKSYTMLYGKILKELEVLFKEKNNLNEIIKEILKTPFKEYSKSYFKLRIIIEVITKIISEKDYQRTVNKFDKDFITKTLKNIKEIYMQMDKGLYEWQKLTNIINK